MLHNASDGAATMLPLRPRLNTRNWRPMMLGRTGGPCSNNNSSKLRNLSFSSSSRFAHRLESNHWPLPKPRSISHPLT